MREFLLGEYGKGECWITESELKKRLDAAWGAASKFAPSDTWDWDKAIEILLNGEAVPTTKSSKRRIK